MSEPTSILTFPDLVTRVAREAGVSYYGPSGDQKALPPVDVHDLELVKEIVNDGIRMFVADAPDVGWRWSKRIASVTLAGTRITGTVDGGSSVTLYDATLFETYTTDNGALVDMYIYVLTGTGKGSWAKILNYDATSVPGTVGVTEWLDQYGNSDGIAPAADDTYAITDVETIGGNIARYPLPEGFCGEVSGNIHYASDSGRHMHVGWVHESEIRSRRVGSVSSGPPIRAAIRPWEPQTGTLSSHPKRRWELIVDPQPSSIDVLEFPYEIIFDKLDMETGVTDTPNDATVELLDATRTEGNDYFNGWVIEIVAGTGKGSYAVVTDYVGSTGQFVVADWLKANGDAGGIDPVADSIYIVQPVNNLHPAGAKFDEVIKAACLGEAEMRIDDIAAQWMQKYIQKALPKAYVADARTAPRKLGSMNRRGRVTCERIWKDVTHS